MGDCGLPSCSFGGEYDATRLSNAVAREAECKYARSLRHAFDVAKQGAVALERINLGRRLLDCRGDVALEMVVLVAVLLSDLAIVSLV